MESNIIKTNEQKLRESEEKYRLISENANDLFAVLNDKFEYEYINEKAYQKILGYSNEEILGKAHYDIIHPKDYKRSHKILRGGLKKGGETGELRLRHKNGKYIWVETKVSVFKNSDGLLKVITISRDLTDRILSEKRLKESEEKYRLISEGSDDLILAYNEKMEIEYVNAETHERILGYSAHLFWKQDFLFSIIHQDDRKILGSAIREGYKGGTYKLHIRYKHEKGDYICFEFRGKTFYDKNGSKKSLVVGRDITDIKLVQDQLQESEEKYRNIIQHAKEGYYEVDLKGNFTFFNKAFCKLLNYSQNELYGMNYAQIMIEHSRNGTFKAFNEAYRNKKEISSLEYTLINKKGEIIYGLTSVNLSYNSEGDIIGFSGFMRDITEQKLVEQKLKESEYKYRHLFETSLYFIGLVNSEGNIIDCNNAMKDIHFLEDVIGKNFKEIFSLNVKNTYLIPIFEKLIKSIFEGENQEGFDFRLERPIGVHLWIHVEFSLIEIENQKLIQFIMQDITERKRSEQLLQESIEELARINAELEQFTYIASHDLKEPLRMISSFTQLLEKRYKDRLDEDANDFISYITDGVARMQDLIKNLLDYSKIGKLNRKFEEVDLNDVLKDVIDNLKPIINETHAKIIYDSLPRLFADRYELLQVFQNIISNAIKFRGSDPPLIHISAKPERMHWVFSIRDNGIGIDSKDFERIFIIFQRLHKAEEYEGTGLGLAICKKIVERQGGKIWLESEVGKGSAFYFSIPREVDIKS